MNSTIMDALQEAYELIKAGKSVEAQKILIPILRDNPDVADAWFLLGKAFKSREKQLYAFRQVLRIEPSNVRALRLIERLTAEPATPKKPRKQGRNVLIWAGSALLGLCCFGMLTLLFVFGGSFRAQLVPLPVTETATVPSAPPSATVIPSPVPSATPNPAVFRPGACPFTVPMGTSVRCGTVRVPQDRHGGGAATIDLPVVRYQSANPNADAVIYLQGGPGVESLDWSLASFENYVKPILQDHDMIFFDPRGTGRSKPALACPELNALFLDAYYQNRSQDDAFQDFLGAWSNCHKRFLAEGVNPAAFNTIESAADVRDIAAALGYKQVNLLGISYGTRLGLTVMRDYPEIVRAAVLDSVVPLQGKMFNRRATDTQYALDKVFNDCANSPRCNTAYPDLANIFKQLIEKFDQTPVSVQAISARRGRFATVNVNGVDMISAVVSGLHHSELVPVVPKAIYDVYNGDYTFLSYALGGRGGDYNTTGLGTYFSTVCPEQVYVSSPAQLDADLNISPLMKQFSLNGLFGSVDNLFKLCSLWDAKPNDPQDSLPVNATHPTLVISGQYDPTTPTLTGEMIAADLSNSHYYMIPGMGHGATVDNACSTAIMLAFLKAPEKAPNSTCLTTNPFEFFLPYDGSTPIDLTEFSDSLYGVRGLVPAGWKKDIAEGFYGRHAYLFDVTQIQATAALAPKNEVLAELKSNFEKSGVIGTPEIVETRKANGYVWTVYGTKLNGEPITIALAQAEDRTLIVIMVVSAPERDAFYNGLFIPMLNALVPLK